MLRVLRGEPIDEVARELNVPAHLIAQLRGYLRLRKVLHTHLVAASAFSELDRTK